MRIAEVNAMRVRDVIPRCICLIVSHQGEIASARINLVVACIEVERVGAVDITVYWLACRIATAQYHLLVDRVCRVCSVYGLCEVIPQAETMYCLA